LRRERRQSPRSEADADHVKVKTEMLQLRLMERRKELVRRDAHEAMIDEMAGLVLTKLGGSRPPGRRRPRMVWLVLREDSYM
jgi:hypothetical protein